MLRSPLGYLEGGQGWVGIWSKAWWGHSAISFGGVWGLAGRRVWSGGETQTRPWILLALVLACWEAEAAVKGWVPAHGGTQPATGSLSLP